MTIELSHGIQIHVNGKGGTIHSNLKQGDEDSSREFNIAVDTLESFLLALAVAGVPLNTPNVIEALETTVDKLFNEFDI